jgi:protein-S-isoprenylcysteine O-methyltransferase Ste14
MHRTRLSLYYLVSYLLGAGVALLVAPHFTLKLLLSSGEYGKVMPRVVGLLLLALGIVMFQIVRHRMEVMYPTTIAVRVVIVLVLAGLYVYSRDPLFLVLIGVVGLGLVLTGSSYLRDHRVATEPTPAGAD